MQLRSDPAPLLENPLLPLLRPRSFTFSPYAVRYVSLSAAAAAAAAAIRRTDAEKGRDGWPEERGPLQSIRPIIIELSFSIIALFCSLSNAAAKKYLFSILRGLIKGKMRKQELFLVQHGNLFSTPRCMIGMQGYQITFLNIPHILCRCI